MLPFFKKYGVSPYAAGGSMMNQSSQQTSGLNSGLNRDSSNDTDQAKKERSTYAEPLPESSRPRRDGPGGN